MNWLQRIERAEKRGHFTETDLELARKWPTCAVGEYRGQYAERPNDKAYPRDVKLRDLGCGFVSAVSGSNLSEAQRLYAAIQKRMARLPKASRA